MSGVAAILHLDGARVSRGALLAVLDGMAHRGPDGCRIWTNGPVGLGQQSFHTTPEDVGVLPPLKSPWQDIWIVADARVDNREDLLSLGAAQAWRGRIPSDAELLLWAYEHWGESFVKRIVGDFAFVLWDERNRKLLCARDPLGVRQLYYTFQGGTFRCASEIQPLFAGGHLARRPCESAMALYLAGSYNERHQTLYEGVFALPPGHQLVIRDGRPGAVEPHWQPERWPRLQVRDEASCAERFQEVLSRAGTCRLRAVGPVAAELSGGLSSSSIVCESARLRSTGSIVSDPLVCLSLVFPGFDCDETRWSVAVAERWRLRHVFVSPTHDREPAQRFPDVYFDPMVRASEPLLREAQRLGARVVLGGLGGDLLLRKTGYEPTSALQSGQVWDAIRASEVLARPWSLVPYRSLLRGFVDTLHAERRRDRGEGGEGRWPWLAANMAEYVEAHARRMARRRFDLHVDPVQAAMMHGITHGAGMGLALSVSDRLAAHLGVERRHPFLDVRVVEALLAFPHEQRWRPGLTKPVLRRAMTGVLPERVRTRTSQTTFDSYLRACFLEPQRGHLQALLHRSRLEERGIVDGDWLRGAVSGLWWSISLADLVRIVSLEIWLRQMP